MGVGVLDGEPGDHVPDLGDDDDDDESNDGGKGDDDWSEIITNITMHDPHCCPHFYLL